MLSLTSASASEIVIGDVADKFKPPCQRVHAVTVTFCRRPDSNQRWQTPALKATDLEHSATTLRRNRMYLPLNLTKLTRGRPCECHHLRCSSTATPPLRQTITGSSALCVNHHGTYSSIRHTKTQASTPRLHQIPSGEQSPWFGWRRKALLSHNKGRQTCYVLHG